MLQANILMKEIQSFEIYSEHFPFCSAKSAFHVSCKSDARLWVSAIFEIIVADWELCIAFLHIALVNNANVATAKDLTFFWIASDGKLNQVQGESFLHIQRENK